MKTVKQKKCGQYSYTSVADVAIRVRDRGLNPDIVLSTDFGDSTKITLLYAMLKGIDVSYIISSATEKAVPSLVKYAKEGFDVTQFFVEGMTSKQLQLAYMSYRMSPDCMSDVKAQKEALAVLEGYREGRTVEQLFEIYLGVLSGVDYTIYADGYQESQMKVIREYLERGCDVSPILDPKYDAGRMSLILKSARKGIDTKYAIDMNYNLQQARILTGAIADGVDCSSFADPSLSAEQMNEARESVKTSTNPAESVKPLTQF